MYTHSRIHSQQTVDLLFRCMLLSIDSISAPSPWPTDDSFHFRVPVASSLLNLPPSCEGGERSSAALTQSLFPEYFQPTIHFPLHNENCKFILYLFAG